MELAQRGSNWPQETEVPLRPPAKALRVTKFVNSRSSLVYIVFMKVCSRNRGYEIDPYCSNGGASESDSARSIDYSGGEDGTL
jgi:hypothetical protein